MYTLGILPGGQTSKGCILIEFDELKTIIKAVPLDEWENLNLRVFGVGNFCPKISDIFNTTVQDMSRS